MEFRLSEEEKLIRDTAAQFVRREILTRERDYLHQEELFLPPGDPPRRVLAPEIFALLWKIARRLGIWALEFPIEGTQQSMSALSRVLVHREFGRTALPFEPAHIPGIMARTPYAGQLLDRELKLCLAFDRIHKTGQLEGAVPRCRDTADGYVFKAATVQVFDPEADLFLLPAREEESGRVGLFLVQRDQIGVSIDDVQDLTADARVAMLTVGECSVPEENRLGGADELAAMVAGEQLNIAGRCLGMAMRCLGDSIEYAKARATFGRPLAQRQAIQWMLADLSMDLSAATWLTLEAAWLMDRGGACVNPAALAKKKAAQMAFQAADTAIQIHGGYGVCKEFPYEGFYREARMMRLLCGREAELDRRTGEEFIEEFS